MGDNLIGGINRNPSVPALDGRDLNWLIAQYIADSRSRLSTKRTVDCYENKLKWFVEWWGVEGPKNEWLLRQADLERFEKYLRDVLSPLTGRKLTYNTRDDVIRILRRALHWAYDSGYVGRDYSNWMPKTDGGPPKRKAISVPSLERLLHAGAGSHNPQRDQAMLAMMMGMGLRRGEVKNLDVECLFFGDDLSGHANVTGKRTRANRTGQRQAAFDSATGLYIMTHLTAAGYTDGPLFRNRFGNRMSDVAINVIVRTAIRRAGLEKEIQGCHDLRRAFATNFRRQNGDKDMLRRQLGHAKYETTDLLYTLLDIEDVKLEMVSPLSSMGAPQQ